MFQKSNIITLLVVFKLSGHIMDISIKFHKLFAIPKDHGELYFVYASCTLGGLFNKTVVPAFRQLIFRQM